MKNNEVTVAILLYHPDIQKTILTIHSVLSQEDVDTEILICDDGSGETHDAIWADCFLRAGFTNYKFLNLPENKGTVQNCLNAAKHANGKYLFLTSPGDFLYDRRTLRRLYDHAENTGSEICFGNAISYKVDKEKQTVTVLEDTDNAPVYLNVYKKGNTKLQKLDFFLEDSIIGASYFRTVSFARESLQKISETAKYMEDKTSSMFALLKGYSISYTNMNVVWYEYGDGISTAKKEQWNQILDDDLMKTAVRLKDEYSKDPCLDYFFSRRNDGKKGTLRRLMIHPVLFFRQIKIRKGTRYRCGFAGYDLSNLKQQLKYQ